MGESAIEWTDATWNPVRGCVKVSPGCRSCYAETFAERFRGTPGHPYEQGFDPRLVPEKLGEPLTWRKPRRVFVNSMSDLFGEFVPRAYVAAVFDRYALSGVVYALAADPELGARSAWRREGVDWRTGESALPRPDLTLVCDAGDKVLNSRIAGRASASEIDTDLALQARVRDLYHSSMWRIQPTDWRCRAVETSSTPEWSLEQAIGFVREVL